MKTSGEDNSSSQTRFQTFYLPLTMKPQLRKALCASLMCTTLLAGPGTAFAQDAVDCNAYAQAAKAGEERAKTRITAQEAATKEALDAAKNCLKRIDDAMAAMIPGIGLSIDFSGLLAGLINKACGVVTSKIDAQGRVIQGSVSDATNRVIGDINGAVGGNVATGGTAGVPTGTPGFNPSTGGLGGTVTAPAPTAPTTTNTSCRLLGIGC